MKNYSTSVIICLSLIAGITNAGQRAVDARKSHARVTPQLIRMRSLPDIRTMEKNSVAEIPPGCKLEKPPVDGSDAEDQSDVSSSAIVKSGVANFASATGGGAPAPPPTSPLRTGTNFNGPAQNGFIPYNAAVAVGPNHVLVMSNAQFAIYTKAGALISLKQNSLLFPIDAGTSYDPKCYYDSSGHFVMLTTQVSNPLSYMNLAVSKTPDPTGEWWMYHLDWTQDGSLQTNNWGDCSTLGYDDSAIYVTSNQVSFGSIYQGSTFQYSKVRILNKSQLFSGAGVTWTDFTNLRNADGTFANCVNAGRMLSSSGSEYLLNSRPGGGNSVTVWRIDNPLTAPTLTLVATVPVGAYTYPPDALQPGRTSPRISTGDARLQDVIMKDGFLYTAFSENYGTTKIKPGSGIRYLKISTNGVVSKNIPYNTAGIDYYYPAVTVDASGNMFMVFSRSSASEYASIYKTGMMITETAIEAPTLVKAGLGIVKNSGWGEYNALQNDPSNPGAVWMYAGWEQANSTWGSWVAATSFGVPPTTRPDDNIAEGVVSSFALNANYPNPFNPSTIISYTLPEETHATLTVYDVLGRQAAVLVDDVQTEGSHHVTFDATGLSSGVYYYRLEAGNNIQMQKMLLMK